MDGKLDGLKKILRETNGVLVAFSRGVDSTFLLKVAHTVLGDQAIGLTAASPHDASGRVGGLRETSHGHRMPAYNHRFSGVAPQPSPKTL